jgi:hypothetical protein
MFALQDANYHVNFAYEWQSQALWFGTDAA